MAISIFSRYYGLEVIAEGDRTSLAQRPIPPVEEYPDGLIHIVIGNETLDQLAARYYGREDLWWRIADANDGKFPLDWQPGDRLTIPPLRVATRTPRR